MNNGKLSIPELAGILFPVLKENPPGAFTTHKKSGGRYIIINVTLREEDLKPLVVYAPASDHEIGYGITFARPYDEFMEKFTNE